MTDNRSRKPRRTAERGSRRDTIALGDLTNWLANLDLGGVKASVHVNGHQFSSTSILTVDLGMPLKSVRLTSDQSHDLGEHMRAAAREILGRDANIRIHHDNSHGIVWASLS